MIGIHRASKSRSQAGARLAWHLVWIAASCSGVSAAQQPDAWTQAFPPHRIVGNVYYVGGADLASFLVTTPEGHVLINSNLEANVPQIQASVAQLGFKLTDVKILLVSHAHFDHCAGSARIKELTGARYMVMDGDVAVVESGGKADFQYSAESSYPAAKVDRVLHDGDVVKLGGMVLTAHKTAGHTRGCTTWSMKVQDAKERKTYDLVIVGSPNVNPGYRLVNNIAYPQIAEDYARAFATWKSLPCDIFLGAHGSYYEMPGKIGRVKDGAINPFIDPAGYRGYIDEREGAFRTELRRQQAAAPGSAPAQ